ncbi:MAG: amidohydrolase, partial [Planctomycetes bacterium]|nr:amidohydrolase [Planctomycetota bacterium]
MSKFTAITIFLIGCVTLALAAGCNTAGSGVKADMVILNGKVWTVDKEKLQAEAVAVWQGQILAVGDSEEIKLLIGPETEVLDVGGKLVLPGFSDSHTHFESGGFNLLGVDLKDAADEEELGERLADASKRLPEGAWITGGNWDHDRWPGGNLPTAELIDRYVPDRPVLVTRYDGHMSVANSAALKLAGVTAATGDPAGGIVVRKAGSQEPAGVLRETAVSLVSRVIPTHSKTEIRRALETALTEAREQGITSVHQVDLTPRDMQIYQELLGEGKLTARMYCCIAISNRKKLVDLGIYNNFNNDNWITIGGVKAFLDGSLGSTTAVFFDPYTQDPSTRGLYVVDLAVLKQQMLEADNAGLQLVIHSIGDKSNSDLLDMFGEIIETNGPRDRRMRVEHAQHMHPKDYIRFAEMGVIASMQPYHA